MCPSILRVGAGAYRSWMGILALGLLLAIMAPSPAGRELESALLAAQQALQRGEAEGALQALDHALKLDPSLTWLHPLAGEAAMAAGDPARALDHYLAAGGREQLTAQQACTFFQASLALGTAAAGAAEFEGCTPAATPVPPPSPSNTNPTTLLAELEGAARTLPGDESAQLRYALALAALQPSESAPVLVELKRTQPGQASLAEDLLALLQDQALTNQPGWLAFGVSQILAAHGHWWEASLALEQAAAADESNPDLLAWRALLRHRLGQDALGDVQQVRRAAPDSVFAAVVEATILRERGTPDQARQVLEGLRSGDGANPMVAAELAATYLELGDLTRAAELYLEAASLERDRPDYWSLLARFSIDHDYDIQGVGLPAARNALALDRRDADNLVLLARAHLEVGSPILADRFLRQALQIDRANPAALYTWGLLLWSKGDAAAARAAFSSALAADPEGPLAGLAERMLEAPGP